MTEEELYEFDLRGFIVYKGALDPGQVAACQKILDKHWNPLKSEEDARHTRFLHLDPMFMDLLERPHTLKILRTLIGEWFRLDHAYAIRMDGKFGRSQGLHGGPRADQGGHQYQWHNNRPYNGLVVVMYALTESPAGGGGFICVPGSHKSNTLSKPKPDSHLVHQPPMEPGDMLVFTEALVHGTGLWKCEHERRSLLYKYCPGYVAWGEYDRIIKPQLDLATSPMQKALLRPPSVGQRDALPFPEGSKPELCWGSY